MTDQRAIVLSGEQGPWFEGKVLGAFGVPTVLTRPGERPFTQVLSSMLAEGLSNAGSDAKVVVVAAGLGADDAIQKVVSAHGTPGIVFEIVQSRYLVTWASAEYEFNYNVIITDRNGTVILQKNYAQYDKGLPINETTPYFDIAAAIYKKRLDEILRDPEVVEALSSLAQPST